MREKIINIKKSFCREKIVRYIKYLLIFTVTLYLFMFIFENKCYIRYKKDGSMNIVTLIKAVVVIGIALMIIFITFVKIKLSDKLNKILSYVLFIISPIICYFTLEVFQQSKYDITISKISFFYILLNIFILFVILMAFFILTNSTKLSVIGLSILTSAFGVINYYVYSFRGIAIVASDLYSVETAASVASDYKLFVDYNIFFIIIATLFIITLACKLRSFRAIITYKLRIPVVCSYIVFLGVFVYVFIFSDQLSSWNINVKLFRPHKAYRTYGSVLSTVRTMGYIIVDKPKRYQADQIEEIAARYSMDEGAEQTPNIIVVMDEAFSDLESIKEFQINEDYMPFIRSLDENTIKGNVYVSSFGGNTANTEFEFLTGNSMAFLPTNSVPYQLFIKEEFPSLTNQLKQQDYVGNIAVHPYRATGYNRKMVYPLMGFESFITIDDFSQDRLLRTKIPDEVDFERVIQEYENAKSKSSKPFFLFNVTMQNHSGYKVTDPNFITRITIEDEYYYDEYTQNYLNLIKYTDEAVQKLIEYFETVEEPTVIIFFGDHQPGLRQSWYDKIFGISEEELSMQELMIKYQVPFFAWANYDIEEDNVDRISMNYLSAYLMDKLGIQLTKYQQYLLDVRKEVPVINSLGYFGADGNFYNYDNIQSPYYEILNEYRNVQYNNMHDKDNRINSMFYLNKN